MTGVQTCALPIWQTQLLLFSAKYVSATTYQVVGQLKILTTALFSRWILRRYLTRIQLASLLLLTAGAGFAASSSTSTTPSSGNGSSSAIISLTLASISSGYANVWAERCLKQRGFLSVNIDMSISSAVLATAQIILSEVVLSNRLMHCGVFCGFNKFVVVIIVLQIVTGLFIGLTLKHADAVVKNFAVSVSLVLTCTLDVVYGFTQGERGLIPATILVVFSLLLFAGAGVSESSFIAACMALVVDFALQELKSAVPAEGGSRSRSR